MRFAGRLQNELEKIWLRRRNVCFFAAASCLCLIWAIAVWVLGGGVLPFTFRLVFSPLTVLAFVSEIYMPALSMFLAGDLFSAELGSGYARWQRAPRAGAASVYFSKLFAIFIWDAANIFALYSVSLLFSACSPQRGLTAAELSEAALAYLVSVAPSLSLAAMFAFVAALFRNPVAAVPIGIGAYASLRLAGALSAAVSEASFLSYMQWHVLWTGGMAPAPKLMNAFVMILSGGAAFTSLGYLAFTHKIRVAAMRREHVDKN
jgi:ABC-2 type transport system permease protein